MTADERLVAKRFPRASNYHPEWVMASASGGANALWLTEWLAEAMDLRPDMRVLDLGCGLAASSIFLRREFGVEVWATDLWFNATDNLQRVRDANVDSGVFPIHADARSLPFASQFFDARVHRLLSLRTDDLNYLARFLAVAYWVSPGPLRQRRRATRPSTKGELPSACIPWGGGAGRLTNIEVATRFLLGQF